MANELWKIQRINEIKKRNKCKHGGDGFSECTSCLADKSLLLDSD